MSEWIIYCIQNKLSDQVFHVHPLLTSVGKVLPVLLVSKFYRFTHSQFPSIQCTSAMLNKKLHVAWQKRALRRCCYCRLFLKWMVLSNHLVQIKQALYLGELVHKTQSIHTKQPAWCWTPKHDFSESTSLSTPLVCRWFKASPAIRVSIGRLFQVHGKWEVKKYSEIQNQLEWHICRIHSAVSLSVMTSLLRAPSFQAKLSTSLQQ